MRMPRLLAVLLVCVAAAAQADSPAHYTYEARIDVHAATLSALLTIDLPKGEARAETQFILGERFKVTSVDAGAGAESNVAPTDKPFPGLQAVTVRATSAAKPPRRIRIAYEGPVNPPADQSPIVAAAPDRIELFIDHMWLPVRSDLGLLYTVDATIRGVPSDLVVVAQGNIRRDGDVVRLKRKASDMDFAWVALRGLKRAVDGNVEIYAEDLDDPYVKLYRRHAATSTAYYEKWFGPMRHRPVRLVVVSRDKGPGYARRGYIVVSKRGGEPNEQGAAGFIGHEFGHAWWYEGGPTTEDYWMTESMASYVSWRYRETVGLGNPPELIAQLREAVRKVPPILGNGRPSGSAVYQKGPLLLLDLEERIGRDKLDQILGALGRDPPRKTAQFLAKVAEIAGPEAARVFEADLRMDGYTR